MRKSSFVNTGLGIAAGVALDSITGGLVGGAVLGLGGAILRSRGEARRLTIKALEWCHTIEEIPPEENRVKAWLSSLLQEEMDILKGVMPLFLQAKDDLDSTADVIQEILDANRLILHAAGASEAQVAAHFVPVICVHGGKFRIVR